MSEGAAANGWATPGSGTEPQATVAPPAPAPGYGQPRRPSNGADLPAATGIIVAGTEGGSTPQLSLRPLTVADILDGAFGIIKARAGLILGFTAALVTPVYLLLAYVSQDAVVEAGLFDQLNPGDDPETGDPGGGGEVGDVLLGFIGHGLTLVAVAAAVAYMLGAWSAGRDVSVGELFGMVAHRSWALGVSFVLVHVIEALGLTGLWVGALFLMPLFVAVAPVIGAEGAGPLGAISRSTRLTSARYWPTLGISLLIGGIAFALDFLLSLWVLIPIELLGWDTAWPLQGLASIMAAIVTTPFVAAATVLLYLDLRMRVEGLDLQLDAQDILPETGS